MGVHVLAIYRPKHGRQGELRTELAAHVPLLRQFGLATAFQSVVLEAPDGSMLECFEWASHDAISKAHEHPEVLSMWERFARCCDYGTLAGLPNADIIFPEFQLVASR